MKRTLSFILVWGLCLTGCWAQKQEGKIVPKFLVNGYFFESMPIIPESVTAEGMDTVLVLKDKAGNEVQAYRFAGELPDSIVKMAIPKKRVQNARFFSGEEDRQRRTIDEERKLLMGWGNRDDVPRVGKTFPLFTERDIDGKPWTYDQMLGRVTVFYLWHSGSVPCLSEMGELSIWKQMYPDVLFLSVTWQDADTVRRIAQQYHFTWTHLCKVHEMMTWVGQGVGGKGVDISYPLTVVVDRQGIVQRVVSGASPEKRQETQNCIQRCR